MVCSIIMTLGICLCPTPYKRKQYVLSASLNKTFPPPPDNADEINKCLIVYINVKFNESVIDLAVFKMHAHVCI